MSKIGKYYKDARERTKRKKSPWNWILFPFAIIGIGGSLFLLVKGLSALQQYLIPNETILSGRTQVGAFLMFIPIAFLTLPLGFMFANFAAWCIPPARRALDNEAKGTKGAAFKEAMKMMSIVSIIILIIVTPACLLGIFNYFYVKSDGIYINSLFSFKEKHYKWSDIVKIETECLSERDNLHLSYILYFRDGLKVNLFGDQYLRFVNTYEKIKPLIRSQIHITYNYKIGNKDVEGLKLRFDSQNVEKIIKIIRNEN